MKAKYHLQEISIDPPSHFIYEGDFDPIECKSKYLLFIYTKKLMIIWLCNFASDSPLYKKDDI